MNKYMHTIDRQPAYYDGEQIVYGIPYLPESKLCESLNQIRKEQRLTVKWRKSMNFSDGSGVYGYLRIKMGE